MYYASKTFTTSGSWVCPAGVTDIIVTTYWTGSGSSGNQPGTTTHIQVTPSTTYSIVIDETLEVMTLGSFVYKVETANNTSTDCFLTLTWMD